MIRWPWKRHAIPEHELEEARRALQRAKASEQRTQRLVRETREELIRNHIALDLKAAMQAGPLPKRGRS